MKTRSLPLVLVACLAVALVASACSGSSSSDSRNAAGVTASLSESDLNEFCAPPRDSFGRPGFDFERNIVTCFVLDNQTKKFSAPNKIDAKVPLTVTKAFCSYNRAPCVDETGYYGDLRTQGIGNVYGFRRLTPDPFTGIGAIQFMPNKIWQGTDNRLFVNSSTAPFTLQQTSAQPEFENPSSGTNGGNCNTQGSFIGCTLDQGSWQRDGKEMRPRYTFFTKPMRITINNNSGSPMTLTTPASPGRGFLIDPVAQGNVDSIATGGQAFVGGYRSTNTDEGQEWSADYCVDYKPTGSLADPTCIPVTITVKVGKVDNKWVNQSSCVVTSRTAAVTIKCDQPTMNESDTDRIVTINVKNF